MTFEELRKLNPWENEITLICNEGIDRTIIGFDSKGLLVTNSAIPSFDYTAWTEADIKGWTIKKPETRKLWQWIVTETKTGYVIIPESLYDKNGFDGMGSENDLWNDNYHRQKIGDPITNQYIKPIPSQE